ncbi:MAG: hypothetical protein ABL888_10170 [Pirellulaceae bacterium]
MSLILLSVAGTNCDAQTITVDIADGDVIDVNPDTATVADLPGPDGHVSFSEAMIASNNTPGRQIIGFAIPQSQWTYLPWYYPGRAVITGMMFYANAYDEVIIDGRTQTAFTGNTNPNGNEVVILRGGGLYIAADACRIFGLDRTNLRIEGSNCLVQNNSEMGIDIYGGSGTLVKNNKGGGYVQIDQSDSNVVVGNTVNRVRVLGWMAGGRPAVNNRIGGPLLSERNFITGQGFINSQGIPGGFAVQLFESVGTIVENNWIGTTPDGLSGGHPATTIGIWLDSENHVVDLRNNRIAGILAVARPRSAPAYLVGTAIQVDGTGNDVAIEGNKIGLNANGQPVLGSVTGINLLNYYLGPVTKVTIGGAAISKRNEIAGHLGNAIRVGNSYSDLLISRNSIHSNGKGGIDLIEAGFQEGITLNDLRDVDSGANGLQNFPVIQSALLTRGQAGSLDTLRVTGAINTSPTTSVIVEFFVSPEPHGSGFGEGKHFVGAIRVTTNANGDAAFDPTFSMPLVAGSGWVITATATNRIRAATSEFSAAVPITLGGLAP